MPPPTPVPRMTPKTIPIVAAASSVASDRAKLLLQIIKFDRLQHASVARGERRSPAPGRSRSIVCRHFSSVSRPAKNDARNFEIEPDAPSARAEEGLDRRG